MIKTPTLLLAALLCCAALGLSACGSGGSTTSASSGSGTAAAAGTASTTGSASSQSISLPTTKFVLHAGLAFGAFHHFIYGPVRSGALRHPFSQKLTLIKAGLAALFVAHELRIAVADAKASTILRPVVAPLTAAANKLAALKNSIVTGAVDPGALSQINGQLGQAGKTAQSAGHGVQDMVPSASQLAAGSSGS